MKQFVFLHIFLSILFISSNISAQVKTWGQNGNGELGDGTQTNRNVPTDALSGYGDITAFAGGQAHTLALRANGTVIAVGYNTYGTLGNGTTATSQITPVTVRNSTNTADLQNIKAISAGQYHSLALDTGGKVWAWGYNANGQLGNNSLTTSTLPVQVGANIGGFDGQVISIDAGFNHTLAVTADGQLWAWGNDDYGQIGDGTNGTNRTVPVKVQTSAGIDFGNVLQVAAGQNHSTALRRDGTVWIWGNNAANQIGNPAAPTGNVLYPYQTKQDNMGSVVQIAAGALHNVALTAAGEVWIWGGNAYGQLGNGATSPSTPEPEKNTSLANIVDVEANNGYHTVVRDNSGQIFDWGYNFYGQIGNGTFSGTSPLAVTTPYQITSLGTGNAVVDTGYSFTYLSNPQIPVAAGTNQTFQGKNLTLNFANVDGAGNVSYAAINPTTTGLTVPNGYTIKANAPAFNITSTAAVGGDITVCLNVPSEYDQMQFGLLKVLHGEGGALIDRTISNNYVNRQICAKVSSLSPFVVAQGLSATAAAVSISGKVSANGRGLANAKVQLTGTGGRTRTILTNPFGSFTFGDVGSGATYIVNVSAKGHAFAPQVVSVTDSTSGLVFTAH